MQEIMTEEHIRKCKEQSLASYKVKDYESALYYTQQWKQLAEENYGYESPEMAHCLRQLGLIHYSMRIPEKVFEEQYGGYDSPLSLYQYLLTLASPFFWLQQNLQQSFVFFEEAYDMLKKTKGIDAPETIKYKKQYVKFVCWETVTAHFEQTLWILIALVPLLVIIVPAISGLYWKSLGMALVILVAVMAWRAISIFLYYFMTKQHYDWVMQ